MHESTLCTIKIYKFISSKKITKMLSKNSIKLDRLEKITFLVGIRSYNYFVAHETRNFEKFNKFEL